MCTKDSNFSHAIVPYSLINMEDSKRALGQIYSLCRQKCVFQETNVQWPFQNSFLVSGTFSLISPASVQVTAETVLFENSTECTSMFHDPCPLIWPTPKKMNNHTLVTRLTFSWHAALFRGQSIKSNQQLQTL